jgi:phosphohistidine phosphatase
MTLYLMRHGEAEPQRTTDDARPLTAVGEATVRAVADGMRQLGLRPRILHSPYIRATQTARLVADVLGVTATAHAAFAPDEPVVVACALLRDACSSSTDVMVISHMPLLPKLAMHVLQHPVGFGTATVAAIECLPDLSRGTLTALWPSSTFTASFPPARFV